jgi:hypothetical protein
VYSWYGRLATRPDGRKPWRWDFMLQI